jgi:hypothetical protein
LNSRRQLVIVIATSRCLPVVRRRAAEQVAIVHCQPPSAAIISLPSVVAVAAQLSPPSPLPSFRLLPPKLCQFIWRLSPLLAATSHTLVVTAAGRRRCLAKVLYY